MGPRAAIQLRPDRIVFDPMEALHLKLPATSANLGPGFDAVGLAMELYLSIRATLAPVFSIEATGRNADRCSSLRRNLILDTYRSLLGTGAPPLALKLHNEIPLGMGCGSSAAALLAGVLLANHFGQLAWTPQQVLEEACRREGHPDNVAACFYGGMTISSVRNGRVIATTCGQALDWKLLLAQPAASLPTRRARALLPDSYSRADAVANVQGAALLVAAFALDRPQLLEAAMRDRMHQPYRMEVCPLLGKLLPLAGQGSARRDKMYGVALSGAGPSVLVLCDPACATDAIVAKIRAAAGDPELEVLETRIANQSVTQMLYEGL